jgi:hypothetical protein
MGKSSSEVLTNNTEGLSASHCRRFCSQTRIVFTNGTHKQHRKYRKTADLTIARASMYISRTSIKLISSSIIGTCPPAHH